MPRLEASVTTAICTQLQNLGWQIDERKPDCTVFQQRAKTPDQQKALKGNKPDFVLYQEGTSTPIGVIEAKKPNDSLDKALNQAEEKYAKPLNAPLIFAYNDTYVATRFLFNEHPLKLDGEDVRQFVDHYTALRFVNEGAEILSAPPQVQYSREQLISIFKKASDLLREAGLQAGLERFGAFSDILFLKIMDEMCELRLHARETPPLDETLRWSHFKELSPKPMHKYINEYVWPKMNEKYGDIFGKQLPIESPEILDDIVQELSKLNLTGSDTDVKGDAFEYFLKNAYQGVSINDLGEYFTPRNIVRTMVSMIDPKYGEKIYDPFCGTGGFLIESFKYIRIRTKLTPTIERTLKEETVYGSELTTNARIAKMNMILFGDGHSNIWKRDSFAHKEEEKYDIVITNPPYSQKTRYGDQYSTSPHDADAVAMAHCFDALNETGRAAVLVKEDFLSEGGDVGRIREYIMRNAKNFSVVSLPRKLFLPYTPTKTSVVYFEKAGKRISAFFYVVRNVGHALTGRKKSIKANDLPNVLDAFNEGKKAMEIDSCIAEMKTIAERQYSLWPYDYMEVVPASPYPMEYLGKYIEESGESVKPSESPEEEFVILGVSNKLGVFENETLLGEQIKQKYIQVHAGDLVYNPHRVNVGSIGLVTEDFDGGYMSGIYVVFRSKEKKVPPEYIHSLLKSQPYKRVIEAYDTKHGAVRANLTYDDLCRIRIPILPDSELKKFMKKQEEIAEMREALKQKESSALDYLTSITSEEDENPYHLEDFNAVIQRASLGSEVDDRT